MASLKTKIACKATILNAAKRYPILYMWTFTFPYALGVDHRMSMKAWAKFLHDARQKGLLKDGLRVCELHKNGALHIHVLCNVRCSILRVRPLWQSYGGGRLHVCPLAGSAGEYVAKYLNKDKSRFVKGVRRWSCWGCWSLWSVRNSDVTFDTLYTRVFKWSYKTIRLNYYAITGKLPTVVKCWSLFIEANNRFILAYLAEGLS